MKELNKILYDILLKIEKKNHDESFDINYLLISKYFNELNNEKSDNYRLFSQYFRNFYNFCFELRPTNMIKDAIKFKV